ncbi:MAG: peptide deformylase [Deltaproteobacteria bacterium]|nr:peptide deformylase [Deltaproteobacteria bacterium]MCL5278084.1 peptide deformylase [Deltaproteobacteria bacterium]
MSLLRICTYPESILKQKAGAVKDIDGALQRLIDDMYETMHTASGVGLAATQVGKDNALFVADVPSGDDKRLVIAVVNPVIVESDGQSSIEEGCLSLPGFRINVKRAARLVIKGYDRDGRELVLEARDLLATVIQHEMDHLNGVTLIDHASLLKREAYLKSLKKDD